MLPERRPVGRPRKAAIAAPEVVQPVPAVVEPAASTPVDISNQQAPTVEESDLIDDLEGQYINSTNDFTEVNKITAESTI